MALLNDNYDGLKEIPKWTRKAIERRLGQGKLVIVSAVCPDYERENGFFTYRGVGKGLPYTAGKHLELVSAINKQAQMEGVTLEYHVTLADTEYDLPLVMQYMTGGNPDEFLRRCESSCREIAVRAQEEGLPLKSCERFTVAFPDWFDFYENAFEFFQSQLNEDSRARMSLAVEAASRMPLYRAMTGHAMVDIDYCEYMVVRQWAQYLAWGECASRKFDQNLVMINHTTPNLKQVNHSFFRNGRERIPILQLSISTEPKT